MNRLLDFIIHIDRHLGEIIQQYGMLAYGLLFAIIFMETGLVITPFLPGDSLLFAAGTFASTGALNAVLLLVLLALAAILGDTINYWIGHALGTVVLEKNSWLIRREYLERTQKFYDKYGAKTIVLARFIPIIRTFAPFVAGIGKMKYPVFLFYNIIGGAAWVSLFVLGGYWFGSLQFVKNNFSFIILAIILTSFIPLLVEIVKHLRHKR